MYKKFILLLLLITSICISAKPGENSHNFNVNQLLQDYFEYKNQYDSLSLSADILNNYTDDFMDNHPANDIYMSIWSKERVNPYKVPIDSLPDSVRIDCSEFVLPVPGKITSKFGSRKTRYHYGTDLKLYTGEPVKAAFSGKIRIIDYERQGYGNYIVVRHDNGLETVYAHLSKVLVEHDQVVAAGDTIGLGGSTGRSTGPHLHFEVRYIGNAINPEKIIDFNTGTLRNDDYLITKNQTFDYHKEVLALQAAKYITVGRGDTLSHIASRNGTSVSKICQLNGISTKSIIKPGQKIRVR